MKLKKIINLMLLITFIAPWQYFIYFHPSPVEAITNSITSRIDFDSGYYDKVESKSVEGQIKLVPDGAWGPRAFKTPNVTLSDQAGIVSDGNNVYVLASGDKHFMRYLPKENRWQTLADSPHYAYPGASLLVLGNYIYAAFGGYQKEYARYSLVNNSWQNLADMPDLIYGGTAMATDGNYIYTLRGTATSDFWKYDPANNVWSVKASTPSTVYTGAGLVYYDGNLYAPRGYSSTTMYRYNIAADTWYTTTTGGSALALPPASFNEDTTITIRNDEIFVVRGIGANAFYKYNITSNAWTTLANTPQPTRYVGNIYNQSDDYIYVFRGNGSYDFWKYDPTNNLFLGPADLPVAPGTGADLVYHGGYLYYPRGASTQTFYRYNISTNTWDAALENIPATLGDDTKGILANDTLYFFRGGNTRTFYSYSPSTTHWSTLSDTAVNIYYGGGLVYPGSGDFIYATRGSLTRTFMKYSISGNSWDDASVADLPDDAEATYGSRMISDGTDIYYIGGYGMSKMWKYAVGTNSWSTVTDVPFAAYYGTDISYYNGKIYAQAGYYKSDFWEYTIASNVWRQLPYIQSAYAYDLGPYNGGSLEVDPTSGTIYSIGGQGLLWMHSFTPSAYNHPVSGTWTSSTIDLNYVSSWTNLTSSIETPGNSSVAIETRSSSDKLTWSEWQSLSGESIQSPVARYIQVKAILNATSDRMQSPIIKSLNVNYRGDENVPTSPTAFVGRSQSVGGSILTSGSSYTYSHPYFTWTGASDSQTNVAGYYVYYGTNDSADPQTAGSYQTTANYTTTLQMTNGSTYYLRLKAKDTAGNISSATTGFIYTYVGVSPPQSIVQTSSSDFSSGTATNISTTGDEIKLTSKSGFWQQERLSLTPSSIYGGTKLAYIASTNKLYIFRSYGSNTFYEYDIATDVWTTKANAPTAVYWGGGVVEGPSGYLYGWAGNNSTAFWRYDIAANTWDDVAASNPPQQLSYGADAIYDGDHYIYVLKGNSDDTLFRYDTSSDIWETRANADFGAPTLQTNNLVSEGGDLAYDGSDTIYAIQGNGRSGFASFSIQGNSWTTLTNLPVLAYNGATITYDSQSNSVYLLPGWDKPYFYKYDITNQTWSILPDAPASIGYGSAARVVNGTLYVVRGAATQSFYKYNIAKNSWLIPNVGLFGGWFRGSEYRTYGYGADIVKGDGDNFYLTRGNYDNLFIRYNSTTGEATKMADAPAGFHLGSELVYDSTNNKIYATGFNYFRKFYVYDIATDAWSELVQDPPLTDVGEGASMTYDGTRYIYLNRGAGSVNFYRYDTQGAAGSRWLARANTSGTMSYGADLIYKNGYVYALRGGNQTSFYRYDPSQNQWSTSAVSNLPTGATIYNDGFLVDGGGDYLYACRGGNQVGCYSYSISGNTWTAIANAPAQIYTGGSAASNGSDKIYVIAGPGTNTFSNGLYTYVMQTDTSSFEESGNYVSPSHNLTATYKYANINLTYTSAANSTLTVYTQSSSDNSNWSDWSEASEVKSVGTTYTYKINSPAAQYVKVKMSLGSSDGVHSGKVSDYTIYYYQDINAPTNPTAINSYSNASHSASITTDTWYNYPSPSFDWPDADEVGGASDGSGGSGIAGYYVYFGTNGSADASTSGTLTASSSYTASGLSSGQTYYLRIQSIDDDGNFSIANWQPFIYKFDSESPTNPVTISVNPPGYTSVNDFDFTMKGATDSASSIAAYCYKYKTGETDGNITYSAEDCITEMDADGTATASAVLAYESGEDNTFYVRTRDKAGNYAPTYATQIYKYSGEAPSMPTNLRITYPADSSSNTVNQFAFAWDAPESYSGSQSGLRYFYSINALPTGNNINEIGLSDSYLPTDAYATQKGTNKLYVVAKDEAGNIDYTNYAQVTFTADTSAPGIPRNIDISDVSIKETSSWRLALSWDPPEASGSGVASYKIYRSAVEDASCTGTFADFNYVASTTQTSYVDTGLTQSKKYYCVKACDSTNECSAVSDSVGLYPDGRWRVAPTLSGDPSTTVKTKSATVSWSTSRTANSFVKYGKTSGNYGEEVGSSTQLTSHTISLTGLDPGTTYYYKVQWTDEDGNLGSSDEFSFTTSPAPYVSTVKFSGVNINSLYVNFTIANAVKATLNYGKTVNYGGTESISTSTNESTYTVALSGLTEGTLYHMKISGEDSEGNAYDSDDYTFETLPTPKILNLKVQQVAGMPTATLRLIWNSNTLISSIVTYYPSDSPGKAVDQINLALKKNHEVVIKNLIDSTDYTIDIKGKDSAGNEATMLTKKLKTSQDMRPPEIQNMNVEATIVGVGETAKAQIVVSWDTDEPSTTQVEYAQGTGTSYGQTTQEDSNLTTNHTVTITGLTPAKIYHLRSISKDKVANSGTSFDTVIITPKSTRDALNLVIENLSTTFGFLNNLKVKK